MKSVLLFILAVLSIDAFSQTIPLDSFYVPGTTWIQAEYFNDYLYTVSKSAYRVEYRIEKDTIVAGGNCHLVSYTTVAGYEYVFIAPGNVSFNYAGPSWSSRHTVGWIRTDCSRVFFTPVGDTERLQYDFSSVPGTMYVDSVQLSDGRYIDMYNQSGSKYWLYGIGSSKGLMVQSGSADQKLLCYDNPGFSYHVYYPDSILPGRLQQNCFDIDNMGLSVSSLAPANNETTIFPNPFTSKDLHFVVHDASKVHSVIVSDISGKMLACFNTFSDGDNILRLPLPAGTYLLRTEYRDHAVTTRKVIKL